jgi:F420-non-reducing hydrogenase iron-sulfur subunit
VFSRGRLPKLRTHLSAFILWPLISERDAMAAHDQLGKILILATESCAYPGANAVGQAHLSYPANTYILRVRAPVLFPERFYLDCFGKGIWGIIIMSCGVECPYEGAYGALAKRVDTVYARMREHGLDIRRLRLTSICTVCTRAFVKEVRQMNELVAELGPPGTEQLTAQIARAG